MYFYISCYSCSHTTDIIEVNGNGDFKKKKLNCLFFSSYNLKSTSRRVKMLDFIYRLKRSERLFIHKNLLLSLGIGNLVYVLDKTLFDSRQDHLVSIYKLKQSLCELITI